jgi:hypothetical protein
MQPDVPGSANATTVGDLRAAASFAEGGVLHNLARIFQTVAPPAGAVALNLRIEQPPDIMADAGAGCYFGYASSSVEMAMFVHQVGPGAEQRRTIAWSTTAFIGFWDSPFSGSLEFPEPLNFTLSMAPGQPPAVTVGVQVDVFAGGGGFAAGASASISTFVPEMTIEWLWP